MCAHPLLGDGIGAYLARAGVDVAVAPAGGGTGSAVLGPRTRLVVVEHAAAPESLALSRIAADATVIDISDSVVRGHRGDGGVDLDGLLGLVAERR